MIRNLANLDRDMNQAIGRIIQEAFADGLVIKKQYSDDLLTGGVDQDILVESVTPNFEIGTRLVIDDRVFRYCKAEGTLIALNGGRCSNFPREGNTDAVVYEAGTYQITIPINPNADKISLEEVEDYWKDGYIWIMEDPIVTKVGQMHRIKSSTAEAGGYVTLTLHRPLKFEVAKSTWITAWANLYKGITGDVDKRMSIVCIPLIPVTDGNYFWGQTWGPIFMSGGTAPGRKDDDREIYSRILGAQGVWSGSDIAFETDVIPQRLGFLITNTNEWTDPASGTEPGGDQFLMLQLSP